MTQSSSYENEQLVWTPADNQSIKNLEKSEKLFANDEKRRLVGIIAVAKKGDNILTV